jgi:dihydrofolate synthase/folylpolyglutamate synthase
VATEALDFARTNGWKAELIADFDEALKAAPTRAPTVLVTGSFHTVGDAMDRLKFSPTAS